MEDWHLFLDELDFLVGQVLRDRGADGTGFELVLELLLDGAEVGGDVVLVAGASL